jgi:hypothetical protein
MTGCRIQCSVCFSEDDSGWGALTCGHVFHANCLVKSLQYSKKCPICREPAVSRAGKDAYRRIYFDAGDGEDPSQGGPSPGGGTGDRPSDLAVDRLRSQVMAREQRLQELGVQLRETEAQLEDAAATIKQLTSRCVMGPRESIVVRSFLQAEMSECRFPHRRRLPLSICFVCP